jgi:predicted HicB family RNase H-like nuclease
VAETRRETTQVTVRILPDLHRRFRQAVFDQDTSIQAEVEKWIVRFVEHHEGRGVKRG